MTHSTPTLRQFYKSMQQWIDDGYPVHDTHSKDTGLCGNLGRWIYSWPELIKNEREIRLDLENQFEIARLNVKFPFNQGNPYHYHREVESRSLYNNPARLKWIKEHAS